MERDDIERPIFISYRRQDADGHARLLYDLLRRWFGPDQVFYDHANLQAGDAFHPKLEAAVQAARVTLVVIAPEWLRVVNERAKFGVFDVVRFEVKTALQQRQTVIPVLMGGASMFGVPALDEVLRDDLGALCGLDAFAFGQKQEQWDHDARRLCERLQGHVTPLPVASDAERMEAASKAIAERLGKRDLKVLAQSDRWGAAPLSGRQPHHAYELLLTFHTAVEAAQDDWSRADLSERDWEVLKADLRHILSVLYGLTHDASAARMLAGTVDVTAPLPGRFAGTAVFTYAMAQGQQAVISANTDNAKTFLPEHTVDLGQVDAGIGEDRKAQVHQGFWVDVFRKPKRAYPHNEKKTSLQGEDLILLRDRLTTRSERLQRANCITAVVPASAAAPQPDDLRSVAAELGCVALPRTGQPGSLLRADEGKVHAQVMSCLETIENLE